MSLNTAKGEREGGEGHFTWEEIRCSGVLKIITIKTLEDLIFIFLMDASQDFQFLKNY